MKQLSIIITTLLAVIILPNNAAADVLVSNVQARQLDRPSKIVEITYDVESDAETVTITLAMSMDGGESWNVPVRTVEGDIGEGVRPGQGKRIRWDAGTDFNNQVQERMRARVTAEEEEQGEELQAGTEREFELADGVNIVMCWIPPGEFNMGSPDNEQDRQENEGPVHRVTFARGFWMSKYELTQAQWVAVMGNNPSYWQGANLPVEQVTWNDIQGFEERLNGEFRLPSEAEWEYACRAGTQTRFYWGDDPQYQQIGDYAWYGANSGNQTHPVGEKRSNAWGLCDMSGNVWEWCEDWYHGDYNGAPNDGSAWVDGGQYRVERGGSWSYSARYCRSAHRGYDSPAVGCSNDGFRVVRSGG